MILAILLVLALVAATCAPIVAYQAGRAWALALPLGLVPLSVWWAVAAEDDHGIPKILLILAVVGLLLTFAALWVARWRRRAL